MPPIRRCSAAGPQLLRECRQLGGCLTGEARITSAYRFPARQIIRTVGPIWHNDSPQEPELLRGCYEHRLSYHFDRRIRISAELRRNHCRENRAE